MGLKHHTGYGCVQKRLMYADETTIKLGLLVIKVRLYWGTAGTQVP